MGEWLGDTPAFQRAMTPEQRADFERFKTPIKAIDTKEIDMAKKNDAQTTLDNIIADAESIKEDTMNEQAAATANTEKKENTMPKYNFREDKARHAAIRDAAKLGRTKPIEVTSCIPGKTAANFTDDPDEVTLLGKAAAKFGWSGEFCTVSQAKKFGGTLDPEYTGHGWLVKYKPYTPKSGKNAGVTTQFETVVYPAEAFVWANGAPELDEQAEAERVAKRAKRAAVRAAKALKEANAAAGIKPKRKTSRKPAAKKVEHIADLPVPAAAPAKLIHIKLANGIEFDARDAKEAAELKALFE